MAGDLPASAHARGVCAHACNTSEPAGVRSGCRDRRQRPSPVCKLVTFNEPAMKSPNVISDPEILGGTPVFIGTRVPMRILFEHLEAGDPLEVFLEDFPSVSRELAVQVLEDAKTALVLDAHPA